MGVLRSQDTKNAIGVRDLNGCSCLVLMGTGPKSAIITAHISITDSEEHYMSLLRLMISIFLKEQELFQLPLAWGIFSHHRKDGFQFNHLAERTLRVFQHLRVHLQIIICGASATQFPHDGYAVVAVRHEPELPEIYVKNRLIYPRVHSGSLALISNRLGIRQIDHEYGDDEEDNDERGGAGERSSEEVGIAHRKLRA